MTGHREAESVKLCVVICWAGSNKRLILNIKNNKIPGFAVISAVLFSRYLDLQRFPHASTPWPGLGGKGAAVSTDQNFQ